MTELATLLGVGCALFIGKHAVDAAGFAAEIGWYAAVATVLSASAPRTAFLHPKLWIDRAAGAVLSALGIKLATSQALP